MLNNKTIQFGISVFVIVLLFISYGCDAHKPSSDKNTNEIPKSIKLYQSFAESSIKDITAGNKIITNYTYDKIKSLFENDVIKYYDLNNKYDTELKQQNFRKTDDYNKKLLQIKDEKKIALAKQFYLIYGGNNSVSYDYKILDYNVGSKFIPINLESELEYSGRPYYESMKTMHKIKMDMLPFEFKDMTPDLFRQPHVIDKRLHLPMSEDLGGIIENNRGSINVLVTFGLNDSLKVQLPIKLYLFNNKTGKIYVVYTYMFD